MPSGADPTTYGVPPDAVELVAARSERAKHWQRADGTRIAIIGTGPLHYRAEVGGPWLDPAEMVVQRSAPGTWTVTTSEISIQTNAGSMTLTHRPTNVSWQWVYQGASVGPNGEIVYQGIPWEYTPSPWGVKSHAVVSASRGPQTYDWLYLTNDPGVVVTEHGDIRGTRWLIRRPFIIGNDGVRYETGPWDLSVASHARFSFDDSTLPETAYPYVIDPSTSIGVATGSDDGQVQRASASSYPPTTTTVVPPNSATIMAEKTNDTGAGYDNYSTRVALIRWDTSALPSGVQVTGATARLYLSRQSADSRNLNGEWIDGSSWPISTSHYTDLVDTSACSVAVSSLTNNASNDITLTDAAANVNLSGYTALRFGISGGRPTYFNNVNIRASESSPAPVLIVEYTVSRTIALTAALKATETRAVALEAALRSSQARGVGLTAGLQATSLRPIALTALLTQGITRSIALEAALLWQARRGVALEALLTRDPLPPPLRALHRPIVTVGTAYHIPLVTLAAIHRPLVTIGEATMTNGAMRAIDIPSSQAITPGEARSFQWNVHDSDGAPVADMSSWTVKFYLLPSVRSVNGLTDLDASTAVLLRKSATADAPAVLVALTAAETQALPVRTLAYEVWRVDTGNERRLAYGAFPVVP